MSLFNNKEYKKALIKFEDILKVESKNSSLLLYLAKTYLYLNDKASAKKYAELALDISPKNSKIKKFLKELP